MSEQFPTPSGNDFKLSGEARVDALPGSMRAPAQNRRGRRLGLAIGRWLAVLLPVAICSGLLAQTPRTIRVVMDNNYAPYSFISADGKLQGILVDQWRAWEKMTGITAELHALDWAEAVRRMRAREFDVIDEINETPERRDYFDFTPAYATIEMPIFFHSEIAGITDVASLKGFPVGIKAGDQHIDRLMAQGITTLIPFPNHGAMISAAKERKINVFVAEAPSALYLLHKLGIAAEFRESAPIFRDGLQRAVRKGNEPLLRTVVQGFADIEPGELKQIDEKWFGRTLGWRREYFIYAGYAVGVALLFVAVLARWNRTLRKRVQQRTAALSESEERFRQIAENIHEVFWLTTLDLSQALYVSPAYEAVWGRSRESFYRDPRSFIAAIHPEDQARAIAAIERQRERGFDIEYRVVRPDGSIRWIRDRGFPIKDDTARAYRIAGIAEDITERKRAEDHVKQAEDRIRVTIDTIPAMVWSVLPDGSVDFLNQRWLDYTGLTMEEEIANPTRAIHPEDLAGVMDTWRLDLAAGQAYEREMRLRRADGEYRWFLVRTAPLRDERGNIVKWFGSSVDIEDRKKAAEALKQAENELRTLLNATPTMIHTGRPDGYLDYFNERWLNFVGWPLEELQGWAWTAVIHPDDLAEELKHWRACIASGDPFDHEVRVRRADGSYRWMLHRKVAVRDGNGAICKWYGSGTDIDDRKQAEDALRSSEQLLQLVLATLPVGVGVTDRMGDFIFINAPAKRIWGEVVASGQERREQSKGFWHDSGKRIAPSEWASARAVSEGQTSLNELIDIETFDGHRKTILNSAAPIRNAEGLIVGAVIINEDVTDRVQAEDALRSSERKLREREEFYRLLTENANDFVRVHEFDGRSIYASPSVERLFGRQPDNLFEFAHPDDREACRKWFARVLAGERQRFSWRVRDRHGNWRWMETQGSLVLHEARPRVMTVCRDVTERKEAEEALRRSEQQLQALVRRLNTAREDEAKRIARELHDVLGQKLTAVNMDLADLEMKLGDASPNQRAQIARTSATVNQTIEVVQKLSGELRLGQLDVLGLTAAIEWQLKEFSHRAKIPCKITRLDEVEDLSDAQSTAVFRILQEALTNIVRHARATQVEVSLEAKPDQLTLRILDNGRGVTAPELNDRKSIGLLGMRERAQSVGGTITITGRPNEGTIVLVAIPRKPTTKNSA